MATVRLTLEIECGVESISGQLTGGHDQRREFCGWTALATTIDAAINGDSEPGHACNRGRSSRMINEEGSDEGD